MFWVIVLLEGSSLVSGQVFVQDHPGFTSSHHPATTKFHWRDGVFRVSLIWSEQLLLRFLPPSTAFRKPKHLSPCCKTVNTTHHSYNETKTKQHSECDVFITKVHHNHCAATWSSWVGSNVLMNSYGGYKLTLNDPLLDFWVRLCCSAPEPHLHWQLLSPV